MPEKGFIQVRATTVDKNIDIIEVERKVGLSPWPFNLDYYLPLLNGFGYEYSVDDLYYIQRNGKVYAVIPTVNYKVVWEGPFLWRMPIPAGVVLIDEDGNTEFLTMEEVLQDPILRNNPVIPESVARWYVDTLNLRKGFFNVWFVHEDQFVIADYGEKNKQPYFLVTNEDRGIWFFAVRPFGGRGIYKAFYIYVSDPNVTVYQVSFPQTGMIGPEASTEYVKKELPIYDWTVMRMSEPIPLLINQSLYWNIKIVPEDYTGIVNIALVDAVTGEVQVSEKRFISLVDETDKVEGILIDIKQYQENGNTRFIVIVEVEGEKQVYIARVEDLEDEDIIKLVTVEPGTTITFRIDDARYIIDVT